MGDATLPAVPASGRPRWQTALRITVTALLLLPLPAAAGTLTIGTWQFQTAPPGWSTNASVGDNLSIQGFGGSTAIGDLTFYAFAPITYGSTPATTISAVTSNFNALTITSGSGVKISMYFATSTPTTPFLYNSNMFTGTLPSSLGTISGSILSGQTYIAVQFDFISGTSWTTTPSSPFRVTFSEM